MTSLRHRLLAAAATAAVTTASLAAVPALAQGAGVQVLMEQANYWRAQGQPMRAAAALERALASQPSNPDVLAAAALLHLELGQPGVAQDMLARLLQVAPEDAKVAKVEAALKAAGDRFAPAAATQERQAGQQAFDLGDPARAARAFEAALARDPADPAALGGLGVIRLRQGRAEEASGLLARAVAVSAAEARRWAAPLEEAAFAAELAAARRLLGRGEAERAEAVLLRATRREALDRAEAEALLGEMALRAGDLTEAEARFRSAQLRRPALPAARDGLLETLRQGNRIAEAEALARQAAAVASPRADALRAEAARTEDPEAAIALLRKAAEASPAPWAKLDLARLLARQGRGAEGRAVLEGGLPASPAPEAVLAAALFASDEGRYADAMRLLDRVPDRVRGPTGTRLLRTLRWQAEVTAALAQDPAGLRGALLAMSGRPDPTGEAALLALRGLLRAGDRDGATEAVRLATAGNRVGTAALRIALAGAMADAGMSREGADLLKPLSADAGIPAAQRRQILALGGPAAPRLAAAVPSVPLEAEPPRIYQGARDPRVAGRIAEAVLRRDPRNVEARLGATEAALMRRDIDAAEALVVEGRFLNASDPRISVAEAQLARVAGDRRRAQTALQLAADQRLAQIGTAATPYRRTVLAGSTAADGQGSSFVPLDSNPASATQVGVTPSQLRASDDPLLSEIGRQLAEVNQEATGRVVPNFAFRARSGERGLERLREYGGGVEAGVPLPGIGGDLSARVQAVTIDASGAGSSTDRLRRFGTNPLHLPGIGDPAAANQFPDSRIRDTSATGTSLGLAYARNGVTVDIGSTPLGFRETTVLGGVEVTPRLAENFQLRLRGERRSVTDSVLSWAGVRDAQSGLTFGGVTRNTGIAQLEYYPGRFGGYVGGGYSYITGNNVADNQRWQAQGGVSYAIIRNPEQELVTGLDLVYFNYQKNLRNFTLGNGGYFSPQTYVSAAVPIDWRERRGNWAYRVGASAGVGYFRERGTAVFPNNPNLQSDLEQAAGRELANGFIIPTRYSGQSTTNFVWGARADLEYALTPTLRVGLSGRYDKSADFEEARALVYARYRFDP
ncbi:cellulose synthase subunit BcsC-related outer membrane protein [Pararoseomonas indoligenes]|uniref:BCSC C-terminal domain-containing protein n=1 Tax=Roseomonas indoligenes TaxID=2820811 RepID=A0A940MV50_9PROT|nr:cellulose synthase subunit BcsC-related outer membrane protein [Pararoseomonas indoligenes]MBP0494733.1 BCSC C-terminal domain-containing protein [Pararoseomonas indoligenes]